MTANDYCPVNFELLKKNNGNMCGSLLRSTVNGKNTCESFNCNNNVGSRFNSKARENFNIPLHMSQSNPYSTMPPPPHKIQNKNEGIYNGNHRNDWKNRNNSRAMSPLDYEREESVKSYRPQGNSAYSKGTKTKSSEDPYYLYNNHFTYGKYGHTSYTFHNGNVSQQRSRYRPSNAYKKSRYSNGNNNQDKVPAEIERRVYGLMERFSSRAKLFDIKENLPKLSNGSAFDKLSKSIWDTYRSKAQSSETYLKKLKLWQDVYLHIRKIMPRYGLFLVGSTMSGLGTEDSDIDMCLLVKPHLSDVRSDALTNLEQIKNALEECDFVDNPKVISAKVPILKFRGAEHGFEVDLNCNNAVGIRNTHLLHSYAQLDWRVRPLVIIVKLWAQANNINDAKNMTISSYSLALMVIHYLQYGVKPPVVPCLHGLLPDKFSSTSEIQGIDIQEEPPTFISDNKMSLGDLLIDFLWYYVCFDYSKLAISVRTGSPLPIDECRFARSLKNDPNQWKYLCIEEPFDLSNTARSVYDLMNFKRIKHVFVMSYRALSTKRDLSSILHNLEIGDQR